MLYNTVDDAPTFNYEVHDAIRRTISLDPDYFRTKYKEFLGGEKYTVEQMAELFYTRFEGMNVSLEGDFVVVQELTDPALKPQPSDVRPTNKYQKDRSDILETAGLPYLKNVLDTLFLKFNLPYKFVFEEDNPVKGYVDVKNYDKPTIIINVARATHDTPLHEYGHIFINLIKTSNKNLYSNLIKEVLNTEKGKEALEETKKYYEKDQIEETIVELLGKYARNELDPKTGLHKAIKQIWDTILEFFSKTFNVEIRDISPNTSIESLAKLLANPNVNFNQKSFIELSLTPEREQRVKDKERLQEQISIISRIEHPVLVETEFKHVILDAREYNALESTVNEIKEYARSQFTKDVKDLLSKVTHPDRIAFTDFYYSEYSPWFKGVLKVISIQPSFALKKLYDISVDAPENLEREIQQLIQKNGLYEHVPTLLRHLLNDYSNPLEKMGVSKPTQYWYGFPPGTVENVEDVVRKIETKIWVLDRYLQNPKDSEEYYNREIEFTTLSDIYTVKGKYSPETKDIEISFSSAKLGYGDANEGAFFKILPKVIDNIAYMFSDVQYDTISFTPITGKSSKGRDLRLKGYNIFAKRLFGQFSLVAENENTTVIPIPEMFKNKVYISENMYQKDRPAAKAPETPTKPAAVKKMSLFPYVDMYASQSVPATGKLADKLVELQNKFKIPYIVIDDPKQKFKGRYVNQGNKKAVIINVAYATEDTPLHEFYHPFVRMMKMRQPNVFASILRLARGANDSRTDEEEIVTDYLARTAQSGYLSVHLQRFLEFIKSLLGLKNELKDTSRLLDILKTLDRGVDVSRESTLLSAFQGIDEMDELINRKVGETKSKVVDYITPLVQQATAYRTSDSSVFYQDAAGNDIAKRVTSFVGDRVYGVFSKRLKKYETTLAESEAKKVFKNAGVNVDKKKPSEITETIVGTDGKTYKFADVVAVFDKEFNRKQMYGKLIHTYMQYMLEPNPAKKELAKQQAIEYANAIGDPYENIDNHPKLNKIRENIRPILRKSGLSLNLAAIGEDPKARADKMAPELTVVSDLLVDDQGNKLGTTIDGLFQHNNGEITLLDWKTGNIVKNMNTPVLMEYGAKFDLNDSALNRAYLELAFRAVMLKEKYPDMRFRSIKIAKLNYDGTVNIMEIDLQPFLSTIGEFYKKNNPDVYKQLEQKGLLKTSNYEGISPVLTVLNRIKDKPRDEAVSYLKDQLQAIYANATPEEIDRDPDLKARVKEFTDAILEIEKLSEMSLKESTKDINKFWGGFKNMSDIDNPKVQVFHKLLLEAKARLREFMGRVESEHDRLYKKVMEEKAGGIGKKAAQLTWVAQAAGVLTLSPPLFFGAIIANAVVNRTLNMTNKQRFAFMWRESKDSNQPGYFMNNKNTYLVNGVETSMTKAEIEYRDFVRESMRQAYNSFANEVVTERFNRGIRRYELLNIPAEMPEGFMPRVPKPLDEVREEEAFSQGMFGIKTNIGGSFKRSLTNFFEENFEEDANGLPLQYMERRDTAVVQEANHTWDTQVAFKYFMSSIKTKQELDPMYNLGHGLRAVLSDDLDENKKPRYDNLVKWLDSQITLQVMDSKKEQKLATKGIKFKMNSLGSKITGIEEGTQMIVSQDRLMKLLQTGTVYTVMAFKIWSPLRNAVLISMQNMTQTTRRIMNKGVSSIVGVPPESFETLDLRGGRDAANSYFKAKMLGQEENNKLWNLVQKFNWLPDNRTYGKDTTSFLSDSIKLTKNSNAYLLYELGENLGAFWHLAGIMRGTKIQDKDGKLVSLWDAYDDKGNWVLGTRGYIQNADGSVTELKELTELEVKSLKRSHEKLNGSYRKEEKTAMEVTIFGDFVMQFHKYFYQYIKVLFASPYKDITVGKYVMTGKKPDGMPMYQ